MAGRGGSSCTDDRNGRAIATLRGGRDSFEGRSPDLSLTNIGGKAAWAFYDRVRDQATIVYDGQDVRTLYGLDRAIAPYEIDGKLIFLGNRAGRSFLVYDGRQVGADWPGRLSLALCCEGVLYNPRYGGGAICSRAARTVQQCASRWRPMGLRLRNSGRSDWRARP